MIERVEARSHPSSSFLLGLVLGSGLTYDLLSRGHAVFPAVLAGLAGLVGGTLLGHLRRLTYVVTPESIRIESRLGTLRSVALGEVRSIELRARHLQRWLGSGDLRLDVGARAPLVLSNVARPAIFLEALEHYRGTVVAPSSAEEKPRVPTLSGTLLLAIVTPGAMALTAALTPWLIRVGLEGVGCNHSVCGWGVPGWNLGLWLTTLMSVGILIGVTLVWMRSEGGRGYHPCIVALGSFVVSLIALTFLPRPLPLGRLLAVLGVACFVGGRIGAVLVVPWPRLGKTRVFRLASVCALALVPLAPLTVSGFVDGRNGFPTGAPIEVRADWARRELGGPYLVAESALEQIPAVHRIFGSAIRTAPRDGALDRVFHGLQGTVTQLQLEIVGDKARGEIDLVFEIPYDHTRPVRVTEGRFRVRDGEVRGDLREGFQEQMSRGL